MAGLWKQFKEMKAREQRLSEMLDSQIRVQTRSLPASSGLGRGIGFNPFTNKWVVPFQNHHVYVPDLNGNKTKFLKNSVKNQTPPGTMEPFK